VRAINHALTGAIIGIVIGEPVVAIPLAIVSHFICDMIPHYGGGTPEAVELKSALFNWLLILDVVLCGALVGVLITVRPDHWLLAAICAFAAASPDFLSLPSYLRVKRGLPPKRDVIREFTVGIQWFQRPIGAVIDVVWFVAALVVLVPLIRYG